MAQAPVKPKPFKLDAGDPVLDFVNTLDDRFSPDGPHELLLSYSELLRFAQQAKILGVKQSQNLSRAANTEAALQAAVELREALANIFYHWADRQSPPAPDLVKLSECCREASRHRKLRWADSCFTWQWAEVDQETKAPVWMLAQHAADLLTSERLALVRSCDNERCRWLFLDTSKNHTRRWCDMKTCGNRMKARRFQARQATIEESA